MTPKIAFLAANSELHAPLELSEEYSAIRDEIKFAEKLGQVQLQSWFGARLEDLREALDGASTVLHICGHQGFSFQTDDGRPTSIGPHPLAQEVEAAKGRRRRAMPPLQLAVLNYCDSDLHAQVLSNYVPCVIATTGKIRDSEAIIFSRVFYHALSNYKTVAEAFEQSSEKLARSRRYPQRDVEAQQCTGTSYALFKLYGNAAKNIRIVQLADRTERLTNSVLSYIYQGIPLWISAIVIVILMMREHSKEVLLAVNDNANDHGHGQMALGDAVRGKDVSAPGSARLDARTEDRLPSSKGLPTAKAKYDRASGVIGERPAVRAQLRSTSPSPVAPKPSDQGRPSGAIDGNEANSRTSVTPIMTIPIPRDGGIVKPVPNLDQMLPDRDWKKGANGGLFK